MSAAKNLRDEVADAVEAYAEASKRLIETQGMAHQAAADQRDAEERIRRDKAAIIADVNGESGEPKVQQAAPWSWAPLHVRIAKTLMDIYPPGTDPEGHRVAAEFLCEHVLGGKEPGDGACVPVTIGGYKAFVERTGSQFVVSFPDCPGCLTFGETYDEAIAMGKEALDGWLAAEAERGK